MSTAEVSAPTRSLPGWGLRLRTGGWLPPLAGVLVLLALWEVVAVTVAAGKHIVPTI
ncbi:MAG: hypothetical protein QOI50_7624, partial [Pseudonocardiales bacterium]|nr:hypothetical protein [Pseudonocardiales bacterium]